MFRVGLRTNVKWRGVLDLVVAVCMIVASVTFVMTALSLRGSVSAARAGASRPVTTEPPLPTEPVLLSGAAIVGRQAAELVVVEFSDFQCPYCARFATDSWPSIRSRFVDSGRVLFVFRHLPLTSAHPFALQAARVAECARRQGRFWEMHDLLFRDGAHVATDGLAETVGRLGIDGEQLSGCVAGEGSDIVESDLAQAKSLGIRGTPTFLFGTSLKDGRFKVLRRQSGALSPESFAEIVASLERDQVSR